MTVEQSGPTLDALRAEIVTLQARLAQDREAARVERDRLTVELGHRVKNTLSVVQALAGQTLRGAAEPQALDAFGERIAALARANDAILKTAWTTATLEETARSVLMPHGDPPGPLAITGGHLPIRASAALSFAMALHELSTNARRCGAWSAPGGRVDLAWTMTQREDATFDLSWTESGGPAVVAPDRRGFGLRLVEQSLRSAFGRGVTVRFEPGGLTVQVRAALDTVAA